VIARQSVWSDPEVRDLTSTFIPAADEVGHLQSGKDAECRLFQKIAEQGHYAGRTKPTSTRQGTYATTAGGTLLASWNNNNPRFVARKLREAVAKWEQLKTEGRQTAGESGLEAADLKRADRFYPANGLVVRVNTRDLPRDKPLEGRWAKAWNQDFAWFTRDEAGQFLPKAPKPGQEHEVPRPLVERLIRFHLLDNVRGQTSPFPASAVDQARLSARITGVEGDVVSLLLKGSTRAVHKGTWPIRGFSDMNNPSPHERGMELDLLGHARYDLKEGRFVALEVVAMGTRWGGTQYNGRGRDLDPAPFGAVLSLAGNAYADRVAPEHFWGYGWR
jgi:hypothetical protein